MTIRSALEKYEDIDINFQGSREGNLMRVSCSLFCIREATLHAPLSQISELRLADTINKSGSRKDTSNRICIDQILAEEISAHFLAVAELRSRKSSSKVSTVCLQSLPSKMFCSAGSCGGF